MSRGETLHTHYEGMEEDPERAQPSALVVDLMAALRESMGLPKRTEAINADAQAADRFASPQDTNEVKAIGKVTE